MASYAGMAAGALALISVLALLIFADPLVNRFVKPRITEAFAGADSAYSIRIADMHYSLFKNRLGIDSVALSANDGTFSGKTHLFSVSRINWMHLLWEGEHRSTGEQLVGSVDYLIAIGDQARYYVEGAIRSGMPAANIYYFDADVENQTELEAAKQDAANLLKKEVREADLVLLKGSRGMRMETILNML